ncbi:tumor necrosis factor receptor superfamily member 1B [Triplophysa rosa]|uniref:Tumor necrosis factor receptor superfamily n=1 Tax=Triplophysa rosa TaxID=992332 RepID=A0A9W7WBI2_TRIRA|nr:tumor necrosis factor receptor superfamily member 1B [Triplophysa rosa]KAI7794852.1 tumor necrosis factor receptor superfamily [Triplophysa rosa]
MILSLRFLFLAAVCRVTVMKISPPYKSDGQCNNSTFEFYNKDARMCCSRCKPGTRLGAPCTSVQDTVCLPCTDGQYSQNTNHYINCFSCKKCSSSKELMYARHCAADTNAVCVCKPASFCVRHASTPTSECTECKRYKSCKPGEGVIKNGTATANVQCGPCSEGTFSSQSDTEPCKPHTQCDGGLVLHPGNSIADTRCGTKPSTAMFSTSEMPKNHPPREIQSETQTAAYITTCLPTLASVTSSTAENRNFIESNDPYPMNFIYIGIVVGFLLVVLTVIVMVITCKLRNRRGLVMDAKTDSKEPNPSSPASVAPEHQCLLPGNSCQKEPSMTSSDSQSQPDSSQSHSSGDWLERTSQEESLHEQHSISSPLVNLSITATINCHLNPATASCSIPVSPSTLAPQADISVPLSQEEVSISCQQEDGKEALQSVQESGLCVF